ncbi:MAG: holo-ACP synthase [Bacteroidota bacterium]|jgi:holo-[acyl-carrier protein] synthase
MITGIGIDIIEIPRIAESISKYGERFLNRIYTAHEIRYCDSFAKHKELHYAARFAAKEAFSKAIGTGITDGFKFNEICVQNEENGKPFIVLSGGLKEKWGGRLTHISLSHTETNAVAMVVIETIE